jgi:hypothetical protein
VNPPRAKARDCRQALHRAGAGQAGVATTCFARNNTELTQAKACDYIPFLFVPHLIMASIICRMRREIRATEVAPTHAGKVKCSFIYANLSN